LQSDFSPGPGSSLSQVAISESVTIRYDTAEPLIEPSARCGKDKIREIELERFNAQIALVFGPTFNVRGMTSMLVSQAPPVWRSEPRQGFEAASPAI
jgi:hypothetical protein